MALVFVFMAAAVCVAAWFGPSRDLPPKSDLVLILARLWALWILWRLLRSMTCRGERFVMATAALVSVRSLAYLAFPEQMAPVYPFLLLLSRWLWIAAVGVSLNMLWSAMRYRRGELRRPVR